MHVTAPAMPSFRPDEIGTIMRTFTFLPLAIALIGASAYAAPQSERPESPLGEIQVRAAVPVYKLTPAQIDEVKGSYVMDNGAHFKITQERRRLYAQLGERLVTEMVAVGENRFISLDQRMVMEFQPMAFGDQIVLTYPSDMNVASSPMVTARFAAN
jgi:hypothetical protein